jgi:hypothetical protein
LINEAGTISTNKAQLIVNSEFCFILLKLLNKSPLNKLLIIYSFCQNKGGPAFVKLPEPLAPVNKDETVRFECIVEANPKPTVSW